ncbi:hypothetical protein [Amycolatopsis plumensis]|uniref:hypothetical protein n=1 Tax=Amycolatopsis plumensis TaxID=236508 RepID=UPI00361C7A3C
MIRVSPAQRTETGYVPGATAATTLSPKNAHGWCPSALRFNGTVMRRALVVTGPASPSHATVRLTFSPGCPLEADSFSQVGSGGGVVVCAAVAVVRASALQERVRLRVLTGTR